MTAHQQARDPSAIIARFNWSNDDWADTWLPWVRVAAVFAAGDRDGVKEILHDDHVVAAEILQGILETKAHLEELVKLTETALERAAELKRH